MRRITAMAPGLLGLFLTASCVAGPATPPTPARVAPTIDAWRALGLSCSGPTKDNVPSGLLQWGCGATVRGAPLTALLDGDDAGVFQVIAQVPSTTDLATARDVFTDLIGVTPAFAEQTRALRDRIRAWDGSEASAATADLRTRLERDHVWTTVVVMSTRQLGPSS